ncbi:MAG: DUF1565 domain-containing protein [Chitinispirillaceae bacterium]|nr:DUF1565 domain-containing protein [Chitinispirillaceae bacterium]
MNTGLTNLDVRTLAVSGTNIFAGTWDGGVFLSTNNGANWTAVNNGLTNLIIQSLAAIGSNLFAGTDGGGVFLSTDNGASWTAANNGITDLDIRALAVSGSSLFAGTNSGGVFLSTDNGASWSAVNTGLNGYRARQILTLAASSTHLFAGTYGGGVWRRPLAEMPENVLVRDQSNNLLATYTTLEPALVNIQSNQKIQVVRGSHSINTEFDLTGSGLTNTTLSFLSPYISVTCNKSIALPDDAASKINGVDGLNYTNSRKILVVSAPKSAAGRIRAMVPDLSTAISISREEETIVLGPGEYTIESDSFHLKNRSLIGTRDPIRGSTEIKLIGQAAHSPINLVGGNEGILIRDIVFRNAQTGQEAGSRMVVATGGWYEQGIAFEIENVEFINDAVDNGGNPVYQQSLAWEISASAGKGTMRNCVFKNFNSPYWMLNDYKIHENAWEVDACDWSDCKDGPIYQVHGPEDTCRGTKKISNSNFGPGPDGARNYMILGTSCFPPYGDDPYYVTTQAEVISRTSGSGKNLYFATPDYVDFLNNDFRLVTTSSLIDDHTNGYTDITSTEANLVITSSAFCNVRVTVPGIPGTGIVEFFDGTKTISGFPDGSVEVSEVTDCNLRPVSRIVIKQFMCGQTIYAIISRRSGYNIPPLADDYNILETTFNCNPISQLSFNFSELPTPPVKSWTIDCTSPFAVSNLKSSVSGTDAVLTWNAGSSSDAMGTTVYRTASPIVQIASLSKSATRYVDSSAAGLGATYTVFVYDSMGNRSAPCQTVPASYLFVDDNGNDTTGNGSREKPYQTIGKAVSRLPANPVNSWVISLFPGEYDEHVKLKNPRRNWSADKRLSFMPRYSAADSMPLWAAFGWNGRSCLEIQGEDYVTVEGIRFMAASADSGHCSGRHAGMLSLVKEAIVIDDNADNATIRRCYFLGTQERKLARGVCANDGADFLRVENCIFYGLADAGIAAGKGGTVPSNLLIINNTFYGCGYAMTLGGGSRISCSRNPGPKNGNNFTNNIVMNSSSGYAFFVASCRLRDGMMAVYASDFHGLSRGVIMPVYAGKCLSFHDTLMRDPLFASTDTTESGSSDFMKPTLPAVACGGLSGTCTPNVDFFNKTRDVPVSMGAVEGAQPAGGENLAKRAAASAEGVRLPMEFGLSQSYPNPFRQTANIRFQIPGTERVRTCIEILRFDGRVVKTLVNDERAPGYYQVAWDGRGNSREALPSGSYLYRIKAGNFYNVKRMVLMR